MKPNPDIVRLFEERHARLSAREAWLLRRRLGLEDGRMWFQRELAEALGLSTTRAGQIEYQAIRRLRREEIAQEMAEFWTEWHKAQQAADVETSP